MFTSLPANPHTHTHTPLCLQTVFGSQTPHHTPRHYHGDGMEEGGWKLSFDSRRISVRESKWGSVSVCFLLNLFLVVVFCWTLIQTSSIKTQPAGWWRQNGVVQRTGETHRFTKCSLAFLRSKATFIQLKRPQRGSQWPQMDKKIIKKTKEKTTWQPHFLIITLFEDVLIRTTTLSVLFCCCLFLCYVGLRTFMSLQ